MQIIKEISIYMINIPFNIIFFDQNNEDVYSFNSDSINQINRNHDQITKDV